MQELHWDLKLKILTILIFGHGAPLQLGEVVSRHKEVTYEFYGRLTWDLELQQTHHH